MSVVEAKVEYTPADLLAMPDGKALELVDGHLVELNVSVLSSRVALKLGRLIDQHAEVNNLGSVLGADCGYRCFPGHPNKVRKPDVSVILRHRLTDELWEEGFASIAPDLAVEVISPNDLAYEVEEKVREYLDAGVRQVWVVYPPTRRVQVRRADGSITELGPDVDLSGEGLLPGFRCRVGEIFPVPASSREKESGSREG